MSFNDSLRHSMRLFIASDAEWAILRHIARDDEVAVRNALQQRSPSRLSETELGQAATHGSMKVLNMYVDDFYDDFRFCSTLAEMALTSGNFAIFEWGVHRTMDAALVTDHEAKNGKRTRTDMENPEWKTWFDAVAYMTVVAARAGQTEALIWMLTGEYKEHFRNPFPEFCLYTEAINRAQWETVRCMMEHKVEGILSPDTQRVLLALTKESFVGEDLKAATLVLENAFDKEGAENKSISLSANIP
ncbi:hypothetical protein CYMTET_28966 [Cymbomonas tetramitiformis]|uniref:Uncharacterized protein n=1 Tax=Cymbomonas tetramitiformis TaxID=36881 RepID=A0AAE0FM23_9CHLO|nr:hypothetical protein CYMTET_28966 [Cymbomonas tetramitiformis]